MTRADCLLIVLAAALIGTLYARHWQSATPAAWVEVRAGSEDLGRYSLDHGRSLDVDGRMGVSRLEIQDGRVRFAHSPCRNQVCVHSGWLSHSGDVAACLPNRVSITLGGGNRAYDAISF